jgi:hypothetical protein
MLAWAIVGSLRGGAQSQVIPKALLRPSGPLTLVDAHGVVNQDPKLTYRSKSFLEFRNDSGESIAVRKPRWIMEAGDVTIHPPFGFSFLPARLWNPAGAPARKWEEETNDNIRLHPNQHLLMWVGLDESLTKAEIDSRRQKQRLGILAISITVAGHDIEQKIRL